LAKRIAKEILDSIKDGRKVLTEVESKEILKAYGIPVVDGHLARTKEEAVAAAEKIGFPVVLKIVSPDILHKSDAKCVILGLNNLTEVESGFDRLLANANRFKRDAEIHGVLVQRMAPRGREVIVGMSKDAQFGPVLMFGLGGVWVEMAEDVSFRVAPIEQKDAVEMIREIRGYPILEGARGGERVDFDALVEILLSASRLAMDWQEIKEFDINPIFAYEKGALSIDARIILE
jgi:acetyl-CoA synthetase (ADP-forming)